MKILQMTKRATGEAVGAVQANAEPGVVKQMWATEGNLACAIEALHGEGVESHGVERTERAAPVFRPVLSPQTAFYRSYTEAMLRRYGVLSMESGRVPSLLGREMFRGKVTSYRVHAFDDVVIFVHDVEQCIKQLTGEQQRLIHRIAVQEYTFPEAAEMFGLSLRSVQRRYLEAVDALTGVFLKRKLLERIATDMCQEGGGSARLVSYSPS
jgi:hypothetical protein